jgi:hypothetical protein
MLLLHRARVTATPKLRIHSVQAVGKYVLTWYGHREHCAAVHVSCGATVDSPLVIIRSALQRLLCTICIIHGWERGEESAPACAGSVDKSDSFSRTRTEPSRSDTHVDGPTHVPCRASRAPTVMQSTLMTHESASHVVPTVVRRALLHTRACASVAQLSPKRTLGLSPAATAVCPPQVSISACASLPGWHGSSICNMERDQRRAGEAGSSV